MAVVYLLTNIANGKLYVGKTKGTLDARWQQHVRDASAAKYPLHRAIRKYGPKSFSRSVLAEFASEEAALAAEKLWIAKLGATGAGGYNVCEGGRGAVGAKIGPAIKAAKATPDGKARTADGAKKRSAIWASRTHCRRGHEATPETTYRPTPTTRVCRICENERHRKARIPKPKPTHCKLGHPFPPKQPGARQRKCPVCLAEWREKLSAERKVMYRAAREAGLSWAEAVEVRDGRRPLPQRVASGS